MIGLVDADSLIYSVGFTFEEKTFWNKEEIKLGIDIEPEITITADLSLTLKALDAKIEKMAFNTGIEEAEFWLTGTDNFRYEVKEDYKHNRKPNAKPIYFKEIWEYLVENYDVKVAVGYEADDIVVYKKRAYPDKYILCAIDKDVLYQTPGVHYNYGKEEFIEIEESFADYFRYFQTLTGDTTDGYIGCKGIGLGAALKILGFPKDNKELMIDFATKKRFKGLPKVLDIPQVEDLWKAVVGAYESKGFTEEDAIIQMRLADMTQLVETKKGEYEIKLFIP